MRDNRKKLGGGTSIKLMRGKFYEQVDKRVAEAVNKKAEIRKVNKEIADLKRARRIRERANIDIDYVHLNVDKTELWAMSKHNNNEFLKETRHQRREEA